MNRLLDIGAVLLVLWAVVAFVVYQWMVNGWAFVAAVIVAIVLTAAVAWIAGRLAGKI